MSFSDAIGRISQIQQQLADLDAGQITAAAQTSGASAGTSTGVGASSATAATPAVTSDFLNALSQAQTDSTSLTSTATVPTATATLPTATATLPTATVTGGAGLSTATTSTPLPASASASLTSSQQQFASTLAGATGLNPGVVTAWLLAEENGSAAQSRQAANNNDWLNIGYTDSATYGGSDSIWSDPVTAANATAQWLKGQDSIPGYGTASGGVQAILQTVGQSPQAQISALQNSGWASGGYPELDTLYNQVVGT